MICEAAVRAELVPGGRKRDRRPSRGGLRWKDSEAEGHQGSLFVWKMSVSEATIKNTNYIVGSTFKETTTVPYPKVC